MTYANQHRSGFGSAEIAAVAGLDRYLSTIELARRKRATLDGSPPDEREQTFAMIRGRVLEPAIVQMVEHRTGLRFAKPPEPIVDRLAIVRPDGLTNEVNLEVKSPSPMVALADWGDDGTGAEGVPQETILQATWQAGAAKRDEVMVGALIGGDCRVYRMPLDRDLYEALHDRATWLWGFIERGVDPPADGSPSTSDYLSRTLRAPVDGLPWIEADAGAEKIIDDFLAARDELKACDERKAAAANLLKQTIGEHPGMTCRGGKVWFTKYKDGAEKRVTDWETVARNIAMAYQVDADDAGRVLDLFDRIVGEHTEVKPGREGIRPLRVIIKKGANR